VADNVKLALLHCTILDPALAVEGVALFVRVISAVEDEQIPLLTVQRKVAVVPTGTPVTPVFVRFTLVIVAVPLTTLHTPVPTVGVVAANVKLPSLHFD
jgi:hypothetical protein